MAEQMDARIASLEAHVSTDAMRYELVQKMDSNHLDHAGRVENLRKDLAARIDGLSDKIDSFRGELFAVKESISSAKVWAVLLYAALAGSMLLVMAHGFHWI
jgi:hypothetical protein